MKENSFSLNSELVFQENPKKLKPKFKSQENYA